MYGKKLRWNLEMWGAPWIKNRLVGSPQILDMIVSISTYEFPLSFNAIIAERVRFSHTFQAYLEARFFKFEVSRQPHYNKTKTFWVCDTKFSLPISWSYQKINLWKTFQLLYIHNILTFTNTLHYSIVFFSKYNCF